VVKDPKYIADAKKTMKFVPETNVGEKGEKLFKRVVDAPPEVIDFILKFIAKGRK
jgi:hypothetical protein